MQNVDCDALYEKKDRIGRCYCNSLKTIGVVSEKCDVVEKLRTTVSYYGCYVDACKDVFGKNKAIKKKGGKNVWTEEAQYCLDYFNYYYNYYSKGSVDFAVVLYGGEIEGQHLDGIYSTNNEDWYLKYIKKSSAKECVN